MSLRRARAFIAALTALGLLGCTSEEVRPQPAPSSTVVSPAPDELATGELAESGTAALGLVLPVGLRIVDITDTRVQARGRQPLEAVANFVRQRVDAESVVTGPARTTFDNVKLKQPRSGAHDAATGQILRVEVATSRGDTTITCSTYRLAEIPSDLTQEQRWERNGIRRDGKPVDPKKFE